MMVGDSSKDSPGKQNQPRLHYLDGIRAFAALWVLMSHIHEATGRVNLSYTPPKVFFSTVSPTSLFNKVIGHFLGLLTKLGNSLFIHFLKRGDYPVSVFIALSGYVLMIPVLKTGGWYRGGVLDFYFRRVWRIIPPYYAILVISIVAGLLFFRNPVGPMGTSQDINPVTVVVHFLMAQDFYKPFSINFPLWTIAIEFQIYLLFPLYLLLRKELGSLGTIGIVFVIVVILMQFRLLHGGDYYAYRPEYLLFFACGTYAAEIVACPESRGRISRFLHDNCGYLILGFIFVGYLADHRLHWLGVAGILSGLVACLLFYLS